MAFPFNFLGRIFRPTAVRQIEAGAGGRRWDGASHLAAPTQSALAARSAAKARASALYINTPLANRIVESWCSALVGRGWQARSQNPDPDTRRALGDDFEALVRPLLVPFARALVRDGEAFVHLILTEGGRLRPKLLAADQIDPSLTRDLGNGARIVAGVEFDAEDHVVAYHVLREAPGSTFSVMGEAVRVPAVDILHIFDPLFPGQVRGLTWLAPVLLKLRDRDEASDAMLMQLKVAALLTGFVSSPEGGTAGLDGDIEGSSVNVSLEPGAMRILPPGAKVEFSDPGKGFTQAVDFLKAQDREIASGVGLTFAMLTGDLGEANYSSERVGLLEFRRRAEMLQRNLVESGLLRPLWQRWISIRELANDLPPTTTAADLLPVRFVAPGWAWVDPRNDVQADVLAISAGLKSREEVVAARGRDIDELDEERARDTSPATKEADK